jgi:hypothetical protein
MTWLPPPFEVPALLNVVTAGSAQDSHHSFINTSQFPDSTSATHLAGSLIAWPQRPPRSVEVLPIK